MLLINKGGFIVMTQLTRKQIAEIIINQKEWSDQEWADATGISRQTFWRMRKNKIKGGQ